MQLIEKIKNTTYKKNIFLSDFLIKQKNRKQNNLVDTKIKTFSKIDSIESTDDLSEFTNSLKSESKIFAKVCIGSESLHYGHIQSLYNYAGLEKIKPIELPRIEHGVNFLESEILTHEINFYHNWIFQGNYKKSLIHRQNPLKPVFSIGPYIHYATNYYSPEKMKLLRGKFGKTLLVIPSHSYELSSMEYDVRKFVDSIVNDYGKRFDTILVCAYWLNLENPVYSLFKSNGAKVVSAGARFDPNFINRLKTLISLSDLVIGNDIGTHIGYCKYLNKPFEMFKSNIVKNDINNFSLQEDKIYKNNKNLFNQAFSGEITDEKKDLQNVLYEKFWGGDSLIKSPEEIKNIIEISNKILKLSRGNTLKFSGIVTKLYQELQVSKMKHELLQFRLLNESIYYN